MKNKSYFEWTKFNFLESQMKTNSQLSFYNHTTVWYLASHFQDHAVQKIEFSNFLV